MTSFISSLVIKDTGLLMKFKSAFFLTLLVPVVSHAGDNYSTYWNARFRFSVDVPTNHFVPQGESGNGDGQVFSSKDGNSEIRAYGGWLMEPEIPCSAGRVFYGEETRITYRHSKGRTSIVSGYMGSRIFYVKTIRTSDRCLNLVIMYPSNDRSQLDSVVKRVSRSFDG